MKKSNQLILFLFTALLIAGCAKQKPSVVTIDVAKNGIEVPKGLWGIFYEEINRAGDGGLWPELIYNMGFEEKNIPSTSYIENGEIVAPKKPSYANGRINNFIFYGFSPNNVTEGWTLENRGNSKSGMEVVSDKPLNKTNPHSLLLKIDKNDGGVNLINEGYKGISLVNGEKYDFQFYLRADKSYSGKVVASLVGKTGNSIYSQEFFVNNSGTWINYKSVIAANVTDNDVKLVMQFTSIGKVWIDYISLLPETTFRGHGLRQDIGSSFDLKIGEWHNIAVTVRGKMVSCAIDGFNLGEKECKDLQKQYTVAGYDTANGEVIVKVVNGVNAPFSTVINLNNAVKVEQAGQIITLTSASLKDDNSFAEPKKVSPVVSEFTGFSNSFKMEFKPNSFTILRIKASREEESIVKKK